jgi:hypothetical protein
MTEINTQRQLPATLTPTHPSQEAQSSNDRAPALDDKTISDQKQHYTLACIHASHTRQTICQN